MKTRRLPVVLAPAVALAVVVGAAVTNWWQHRPVEFDGAPKLVDALRSFSKDMAVRGQPLPPTVSLRDLVSGGYLAAGDVRAFDGMDVVVSLTGDETRPEERLIRVRMPDGRVTVLMADGSAQESRP